jgi:hypothetical protein
MTGLWLKIIFAASGLWCVVGFGILVSCGFLRDFDPSTSLVVLLSIGVLGGFARLLVGRRHGGKLVFWCRRFGDTDGLAGQLNRWHGRIIDEATKGIAMPVTLQDESVDKPPLVAYAVVLPVFVGMLPGSLGSTLWLFELSWFDTPLGKIAAFVTVVLAFTAPSIVAVLVARWLGTRRVVPGSVARTAHRAVRGNRSRAEMLVLQCKSEHWQACVIELLDLAVFAIIDVSVPSTNVEWEVETVAQRLGPRGLLLIQAEEKTKDLVEWSQEDGWAILRYDMSRAADELAAFSKSWREEKHQLTNPDASLGPIGSTMANAIKEWMKHS